MKRIKGMAGFLGEAAEAPSFRPISEDEYWGYIESQGHELMPQWVRDEIKRVGDSLFDYFSVSLVQRYVKDGFKHRYYNMWFLPRGYRLGLVTTRLTLTDEDWFLVNYVDEAGVQAYRCDGLDGLKELLHHIAKNN